MSDDTPPTSNGDSTLVAGSSLLIGPDEVDFGEVVAGTSEQRTLILTNTGDTELLLDDISVPAPFQVMDRGLTLAPGKSARITVVLRAKANSTTVPGDARLRLASDALPNGQVDVPIRATVTRPAAIAVEPLIVDFGQVDLYGKANALLTIENKGERELRIKNLTSPRPFRVEVAQMTLAQGERRQVEVSFTPDKAGAGEAKMLVRSDDPKRNTILVQLRGTGVAEPPKPVIEVSADRVDFGKVSLADKRQRWIYIRNHGADPLHVTSVTSTPPFKTPSRGRRVKPGGSMRVAVSFEPTDEGTESAPLVIHSNDPEEGVLVVDLSGEGTLGAGDPESQIASNDDAGDYAVRGGGEGAGSDFGSDASDGDVGAAAGETPRDEVANFVPFEPAIGDDSYVYIGTHRSQISPADVQQLVVDRAAGRFEMNQLMLPTVEFPFGQFFEFPPIDVSGAISANGDISIPITVPIVTESGNQIDLPMVLTTETVNMLMPDGRQVPYTGAPVDGRQIVRLVAAEPGNTGQIEGIPIVFAFDIEWIQQQ